jgi:hypothetical protein
LKEEKKKEDETYTNNRTTNNDINKNSKNTSSISAIKQLDKQHDKKEQKSSDFNEFNDFDDILNIKKDTSKITQIDPMYNISNQSNNQNSNNIDFSNSYKPKIGDRNFRSGNNNGNHGGLLGISSPIRKTNNYDNPLENMKINLLQENISKNKLVPGGLGGTIQGTSMNRQGVGIGGGLTGLGGKSAFNKPSYLESNSPKFSKNEIGSGNNISNNTKIVNPNSNSIMNSGIDKDEFGFGGSRRKKNNQNNNNIQNNNNNNTTNNQESKFSSNSNFNNMNNNLINNNSNNTRHEINSNF